MDVSKELLFFFSALGAFNGIVLSLYFLFVAKPKHISNRFLGTFLLMMSIRTGKSVFFYFNPNLSYHYLQFGLTACFFIGPFLYFYVKSMVLPNSTINKEWKYHCIILLLIALVCGFLYPFKTNIDLWRPYIIKTIYYVWFTYSLLAGYILLPTIKKMLNSKHKMTSLEFWILSIYVGNLVVWASYNYSRFTSYITGALTFTFLFYLVALFLFFNKKKRTILFLQNKKYSDKKIEGTEANALINKLEVIMESEELYKNPNLKSADVAKKMQLTTHQFSQLLNDNLNKNFASFINQYRIEAAKKMLKENSSFTLEAIAYECGFNSKSTFYTYFKKMEGKTPAQFRSSNL